MRALALSRPLKIVLSLRERERERDGYERLNAKIDEVHRVVIATVFQGWFDSAKGETSDGGSVEQDRFREEQEEGELGRGARKL